MATITNLKEFRFFMSGLFKSSLSEDEKIESLEKVCLMACDDLREEIYEFREELFQSLRTSRLFMKTLEIEVPILELLDDLLVNDDKDNDGRKIPINTFMKYLNQPLQLATDKSKSPKLKPRMDDSVPSNATFN